MPNIVDTYGQILSYCLIEVYNKYEVNSKMNSRQIDPISGNVTEKENYNNRWVHIYLYLYLYLAINLSIHLSIYLCIYIHTPIYMMYIYVYIYICSMYIYV